MELELQAGRKRQLGIPTKPLPGALGTDWQLREVQKEQRRVTGKVPRHRETGTHSGAAAQQKLTG